VPAACASRGLDPEDGAELWNLGFPEFAALAILDLADGALILGGANDDEAALVAVEID
jgi:hypothetical protein